MGLLNEYANTALSEMQQVFDRMDDKDLQPCLLYTSDAADE